MDQEQSLQKLVPAVERASAILDVISNSRKFLTVSELARETDLPKSTVHALCGTMIQLGLLLRRPDQTYGLGPHILRWANAFSRQTDVATEFAALWDQMRFPTEATVTLCVPEGNEVVFIAARQPMAGNRFQVRPGMRLSALFTAAGKALLARLSDFEIRKAYADGLPEPMTEHSIRTLEALLDDIRLTREKGFAVEVEQAFEGLSSVGAAVLDSVNRPLAAVMLTLPSELATPTLLTEQAQAIRQAAERLSRRMGADLPQVS